MQKDMKLFFMTLLLACTTMHTAQPTNPDYDKKLFIEPFPAYPGNAINKGTYERMKLFYQCPLPLFTNTLTTTADDIKKRIQSALILGAFGDALGNPVEFTVVRKGSAICGVRTLGDLVKKRAAVGSQAGREPELFYKDNYVIVTDDTIMSAISLDVLGQNLNASVIELSDLLARAFVDDYKNSTYDNWAAPDRAPGGRCTAAADVIKNKSQHTPLWFYAGMNNVYTEGGCGVIMRIAPLGWAYYNNIALAAHAGALCAITHSADSSIIASACFAAANAAALQGKNIDQIIDIVQMVAKTYDKAVANNRNDPGTNVVRKIAQLKAYSDDELTNATFYANHTGFGAADFLVAVLGTAKKHQYGTVQDGVLSVVHAPARCTIDRDSVASGVGQLMAAMGCPAGFDIEKDSKHLEMYERLSAIAQTAAEKIVS